MATAAERLEAHIPRTKSSESNLVISSVTARELLNELEDGELKDRFDAVVPDVRSSEANAAFSQQLAKDVLAAVS